MRHDFLDDYPDAMEPPQACAVDFTVSPRARRRRMTASTAASARLSQISRCRAAAHTAHMIARTAASGPQHNDGMVVLAPPRRCG
ncbi:hypothetical protein B8W66_06015 [Mycobacterium decipiens]|uniref:Uncharacterized protein n=1 Tax=Mycobacterium decipiens TaxID=1430326 RepID=A0A1X2LZF2_9MYCO|nr:hypothetical protein B8W66_06015 [Mycobacterium decipiens]